MIKEPKYKCIIGVIGYLDYSDGVYAENICIIYTGSMPSLDIVMAINNQNSYKILPNGSLGSFYIPQKKPPINFPQMDLNHD